MRSALMACTSQSCPVQAEGNDDACEALSSDELDLLLLTSDDKDVHERDFAAVTTAVALRTTNCSESNNIVTHANMLRVAEPHSNAHATSR
jgi:hypothetical protein